MSRQATKNNMLVRIFSPQGLVYEHRATSCSVEAVDGGMTILPGHTAALVALAISDVKVTRLIEGDPVDHIAINGGVLEVHHNEIEIISNYAIRARDIDDMTVEMEKEQAEADLAKANRQGDRIAYKRAEIELSRALNKIRVSRQRRI